MERFVENKQLPLSFCSLSADQVDLGKALGLLPTESPFPWQLNLLDRWMKGESYRYLDIPTGLGKTSVMAIWLLVRAFRPEYAPRRLVYVVDRRAVVDQATEVAEKLRDYVSSQPEIGKKLGLDGKPLPISTLRGQHIDNKEWLTDPSLPAIIVGTIDMVGSRLLFGGYRVSRKMRPYHAALMGTDGLIVFDEAHLVPGFEGLLRQVEDLKGMLGPNTEEFRRLVPPFRFMSLSATGRGGEAHAFRLSDADVVHPIVGQRLRAVKRIEVDFVREAKEIPQKIAEHAWKLAQQGQKNIRCIVFCDRREDARAAKEALEDLGKKAHKDDSTVPVPDCELLVGGRRLFERTGGAKRVHQLGFVAGSLGIAERPVFLFATSAGEVGIDLDADHMVCDLVAWERMVQRLGRVNRRGKGDARVVVVTTAEISPPKAIQTILDKDEDKRKNKEREKLAQWDRENALDSARLKILEQLDELPGGKDGSPAGILALKTRASQDPSLAKLLHNAQTMLPLFPPIHRATVDAWSMTSLVEHTGRPEIRPWLRGWVPNDPPQTTVVWRRWLPVREHGTEPDRSEMGRFFEAAPIHLSETLETETYRVQAWLIKGAERLLGKPLKPTSEQAPAEMEIGCANWSGHHVVAILLGDDNRVLESFELKWLVPHKDDKRGKSNRDKTLERLLPYGSLVVDRRFGGLEDGLLNDKWVELPKTADGEDDCSFRATGVDVGFKALPTVRFRIEERTTDSSSVDLSSQGWRERDRFVRVFGPDGEPLRWLTIYKWHDDGATEEDRSVGPAQLLNEHQSCAEKKAWDLGQRMGLPEEYARMLAMAARLHDEGKRSRLWQQAFGAPEDGVYAKTPKPKNLRLLDGYRHEFGSLPYVKADPEWQKLPEHLQDLVLHIIAAHHGFARPIISTAGCEDAPPSALKERAAEVALRFVRLQKAWGPWGLAFWETLLRAADVQASRDNEYREKRDG